MLGYVCIQCMCMGVFILLVYICSVYICMGVCVCVCMYGCVCAASFSFPGLLHLQFLIHTASDHKLEV